MSKRFTENNGHPYAIILVAILSTVIAIFLMALDITYLAYFDPMWPKFCDHIYCEEDKMESENIYYCKQLADINRKVSIGSIIYMIIFIGSSLLLVKGTREEKVAYIIPYEICLAAVTVLTFVWFAYLMTYTSFAIQMTLSVFIVFYLFIAMIFYVTVSVHTSQLKLSKLLESSIEESDEEFLANFFTSKKEKVSYANKAYNNSESSRSSPQTNILVLSASDLSAAAQEDDRIVVSPLLSELKMTPETRQVSPVSRTLSTEPNIVETGHQTQEVTETVKTDDKTDNQTITNNKHEWSHYKPLRNIKKFEENVPLESRKSPKPGKSILKVPGKRPSVSVISPTRKPRKVSYERYF